MSIAEVQKWLNDNRGEYEAAKINLADPEFVLQMLVDLRSATIGLTAYNPIEHPPHAAVAWLVEARERMGGIFDDLAIIERFEEYRGMVNEGEEYSNE